MRSVYTRIRAWLDTASPGVLARLVDAAGSTPREVGALMLVGADGAVIGSLSGGCVESAVVERARALLARPTPTAVLVELGTGSDPDLDAGLLCGGSMTVLFQTITPGDRPALRQFCEAQIEGVPAVFATRVAGDDVASCMTVVCPDADASDTAGPAIRLVDSDLVLHTSRPKPRLIVAGADDFADALGRTADGLGWRVVVVDPRAALATDDRFPAARVVVAWPDRHLAEVGGSLGPADAVCVLSHDRRIDVPTLIAALRTDVGYIGAMGSRATHEDRVRRLREAGADGADLARIHSPIGLDIGAATPEETAIAIVAEIVSVRAGRSGGPLREGRGPIRASHSAIVCDSMPG